MGKLAPLLAFLAIVSLACATAEVPVNTPFPFTITIATPEPTLDLANCSTTICCSNCPAIPIHRVIDGDTFVSANATIRLFGVDTPELGEPCYDEATQRLRELAGDSVRVAFGPRQGDRYGRILYYVYTMEGESIDEMLAREGLALAWLQDGQHRNALLAVEARANEGGRGCLGGDSESTTGTGGCDPSYPTICIPSPPPNLECGQIQYRRFEVVPLDPHGFDGDKDGIGCES